MMTMRPALRPPMQSAMRPPLNPIKGGGDIIRSIFADGTDGFYFDFSKTDRLFQTVNGGALADDAGENIGLGLDSHAWAGRTLAAEVAQQAEVLTNGGFDADTNWTKGAGWTISGGVANAAVASGNTDIRSSSNVTTVGKTYLMSFDLVVSAGGVRWYLGGTTAPATISASGSYSVVVKATSAIYVAFIAYGGGGAFTGTIDNVSIKEIPGNHGLQATTAAQPKWQTGGLARFDGSDDHLLTAMKAASAMSLVFKCKASAANGFLTGVRASGTNDRFYLGFDGSGQLHSIIGDSATGTITRSGSLVGTTGVAALSVPGDGTAELFWNGVSVGTGSGLLAINLTQVFAVGGVVIGGTPQSFINGDIYHALAIKKALPAAQIAAITNLWGTS